MSMIEIRRKPVGRSIREGALEFSIGQEELERISTSFDRYAITFGLYKNQSFQDRVFPFGVIPRVIGRWEFDTIEKGLEQRVAALNCFLADIYGKRQILKDKVIPEDFVYASAGFMPECDGVVPPKGIFSHISGIDLVQAKEGAWYVLEDNLRVPSGASYPLIARKLVRGLSPELFGPLPVADSRDYPRMLLDVMENVNQGGLNILLSPGRYNSAFFEHAYLAEQMNIRLAFGSDLTVEDDFVYYRDVSGKLLRVGAIYRRLSDEFLDPLEFDAESLIGVPGLFRAYKKGNVAIINAPGNGVADDKGIYYFVPDMIRYYLGQTAILKNAPTYLPLVEKDKKYVIEHLRSLVVKDVSEAGGYGVVFGDRLSKAKLDELKSAILREPRRFIAQEVVDFRDLPVFRGRRVVRRKADFRAYVLYGQEIKVWKSGLTRYAMDHGSMVVNSSQGGGFKDTWVLYR